MNDEDTPPNLEIISYTPRLFARIEVGIISEFRALITISIVSIHNFPAMKITKATISRSEIEKIVFQ